MRRLALMLVGLAVALVMAIAVRAEPVRQQSQVQITSPEMNAELRGQVEIVGSSSVANFQYYKVEYGMGPNPAQWVLIGSTHDTPIINGRLEVWDTTRFPDGVYSLRLQAVKRDGNYDEFYVRQVAVANTRPTPTPAPSDTPTPQAPTPTRPTTPEATATLQIIAPTAALSMPSPTPTLSRPADRSPLPINPGSWPQAFCSGALAIGAVFVLLGIVFGLRRLL